METVALKFVNKSRWGLNIFCKRDVKENRGQTCDLQRIRDVRNARAES